MTTDLFAYGTLMCEDILFSVTGFHLKGVRGLLHDYQRRQFQGEAYPGITMKQNQTVDGLVYSNLSNATWSCLDAFEGERFSRNTVKVKLEDGTVRQAQTYVLKAEFANLLSNNPWDFEVFLKSGKVLFESNYFGFDALKK